MDSALAGSVSTALSVVTELNLPLSGTMTAASATHNPITNHGTHRPANRPADASPDGAALTATTSLLHTSYIAYLMPTSYRANLRRPLKRRSGRLADPGAQRTHQLRRALILVRVSNGAPESSTVVPPPSRGRRLQYDETGRNRA
ncbi:hypothetical protein GCM10027615_60180 [Plantactinospora veratri]